MFAWEAGMNASKLAVAVSALLLVVGPAGAAGDVLQLGGVKGEASDAGTTVEVQSFSWGVHKAGAGATGQGRVGTGKASMSDLSVSAEAVRSPRDAATGQASGRRSVAAGDVDGDGSADVAVAPKVGDVTDFTVVSKDAGPRCVQGTHFPTAVLTASGKRYEFQDVEVTSCEAAGAVRKTGFRGHVTLMK